MGNLKGNVQHMDGVWVNDFFWSTYGVLQRILPVSKCELYVSSLLVKEYLKRVTRPVYSSYHITVC
jgi:hypothetical protein